MRSQRRFARFLLCTTGSWMRHAPVPSPIFPDACNPGLRKALTSHSGLSGAPARSRRASTKSPRQHEVAAPARCRRAPARRAVPISLPSHRRLGSARLLLFAHLSQRQAGIAGNDLEDGVGCIGWQPQSMHLLPRPDAHLGWIQIRALFFQVDAPALGALLFFQGAPRAVIVAQITGVAVRGSIVRKRRRRWGHWFSSLARPGRLRLTSSRRSVDSTRISIRADARDAGSRERAAGPRHRLPATSSESALVTRILTVKSSLRPVDRVAPVRDSGIDTILE